MTWARSSLQYLVDCNNVQNLPTLTFVISGVQFPLSPSAYILSVSAGLRGCATSPGWEEGTGEIPGNSERCRN